MPSDSILKTLSEGGYEVRISDYKKSDNVNMLKEIFEQQKIPYRMYEFVGKKGLWNDSGDRFYMEPEDCNTEDKVLHCGWCTCYTVENHLVGRCARSIPAISVQGIDKRELDYLDLSEGLSVESVRNYFMFIKPMEACRRCKGSTGEAIEAAIQLK